MVKTYLLDTNILMSTEGRALYGFVDNNVAISQVTLEELDNNKTAPGERGFQAREAIRTIDNIIDAQPDVNVMEQGAILPDGGRFLILNERYTVLSSDDSIPTSWKENKPDNIILTDCKKHSIKKPTILVTNDTSMRIKAMSYGLAVQDYRNDQVKGEYEYSGRAEMFVSDELVSRFYEQGYIDEVDSTDFSPNEYVIVHSETNDQNNALARFDAETDTLRLIRSPKSIFGISPKNSGQRFALDALLAPADEIPLVILKGAAGTGKTILSMAVGLDGAYDSKRDRRYDSVVITRSNTLSDEDLGFLPGSLEDKMEPLLAPFFDNTRYLLGKNIEDRDMVNKQIDDMIETGVIEITSLSYIRGRSLNNTFLILDEAQNISRLQAKTLVTRMGMGSKLVVLGDPNQIDNPKLDRKSNGLVYLSEKFKGSPLCAQVEFSDSESVRSPLAKDAIMRLE